MHQQILGLWVVPNHEAEKPRWKGDDRLCYSTYIGTFEKKKEGLFVTNPAFQQWLQENPQWAGCQLGTIELGIREKEKIVSIDWFYPFGDHPTKGKKKGVWHYPKEFFGNKGIGSFAFHRVLNETEKMFPSFKVKFGTTLQPEMRDLLGKMG